MFIIHYVEQPVVFLIIRQCKNEESIRSFYEKILVLFLNRSKPQECHLYKLNLHLPMIFFLLKCFYYLWLCKKLCYFILQRQIHPFIHIRSVALVSQNIPKK